MFPGVPCRLVKSPALLVLGFGLGVAISNSAAADNVLITEFMAVNGGVHRDVDGDSSDWIEIYNAESAPVNLAGWHLTDDPNELAKWTFPQTTLAGGSFLMVYASGKDGMLRGWQLHTNFELDNAGEYLALVRPDGSIAHEYAPVFPPQVVD